MIKRTATLISILIIGLTSLHANEDISETEITKSINKGVSGTKEILKKVSIYQLFPENKTLLHYAVELDQYDVVSFLVNRDILLSQKGGEFYGTALQEAIYYGYPDIANFLIEQDTPLNIQDINGDTALHLATRNGDLDIVTTLLSHGANKTIFNNDGNLAYDLVPTLSWDSEKEIKDLLDIHSKKNKFKYPSLELDDILEVLPVQQRNNKTINNIDTQSNIINSNLNINIYNKDKKNF